MYIRKNTAINQAHLQSSIKGEYWKEHLQQYEASGMSKAA